MTGSGSDNNIGQQRSQIGCSLAQSRESRRRGVTGRLLRDSTTSSACLSTHRPLGRSHDERSQLKIDASMRLVCELLELKLLSMCGSCNVRTRHQIDHRTRHRDSESTRCSIAAFSDQVLPDSGFQRFGCLKSSSLSHPSRSQQPYLLALRCCEYTSCE